MKILEEHDLIKTYLDNYSEAANPIMIQIGANEGKYEYAKKDGKDFVFEFLQNRSYWNAVLIEPIPPIFDQLKKNYNQHDNVLTFLNCAVADKQETLSLQVIGKEGKSSSFLPVKNKVVQKTIPVECMTYDYICKILGLKNVNFVKIDAEGYDEIIVQSILTSTDVNALPEIIFWESLSPKKGECEDNLADLGYSVFHTGLNTSERYMDRVAIHNSLM